MISDRQQVTMPNAHAIAPPESHITWLAVDATPSKCRLVVVNDGHTLGTFEATTGPRQAPRTLDFIRKTAPVDTNLKLVGRRYDQWPPELYSALLQAHGAVTWLDPNILNTTLPEVDRWRRMFSTYRALFFAICAEEGSKRPLSYLDQFELLYAWKKAVLHDLLSDLELLGAHPPQF